jgi:hypothetical protein
VPNKTLKTLAIAAAASIAGSLTYTPVAQAFGFGDMMNPSKWMGGRNRDRYDDDYYDGGYGGPGFGGPGFGGPGYGYGGPGYGYGGPGFGGYGVPGYGYGAPGYGAPAVAAPVPAAPAAAPAQSSSQSSTRSSSASEIEALKRRIDELEASQRPSPSSSTQAPAAADWPSAPAFRPINKY